MGNWSAPVLLRCIDSYCQLHAKLVLLTVDFWGNFDSESYLLLHLYLTKEDFFTFSCNIFYYYYLVRLSLAQTDS